MRRAAVLSGQPEDLKQCVERLEKRHSREVAAFEADKLHGPAATLSGSV